jgi:hypothetical protein
MEKNRKPIIDSVIFFVSMLVMFFWILTNRINIYENKFIGIIAEILWLPFILLIFVLPIFTTVLIFTRKLKKSKILFLSLAIQALILIMQFTK